MSRSGPDFLPGERTIATTMTATNAAMITVRPMHPLKINLRPFLPVLRAFAARQALAADVARPSVLMVSMMAAQGGFGQVRAIYDSATM